MKVLLTATVQSHICQFHKTLVKVLHDEGCEVHVAARNNLAEKNGLKLDFVDKVYNIPFSRSPKSVDNIKAYKKLKRIIEREKYDVIHCNTPMGGIITRLAACKSRKKGTKVYYTAHGFHFYKGAPKKNWIIFYPIEIFMAHFTDVLITITKEDYELAKKKFNCLVKHVHGVGVNTQKYNSVTKEEAIEFKNKNGWEKNYLILCTGELNANKNQSTLIKAMPQVIKKIPNVKLLLAGNGPYEKNLKELIAELKLEENVILLGYKTNLEWYVHACDFVVTASFREGLPVNVLEAMYCEKAVIASNNRGHRELVKDGITGYLVKGKDSKGFSNKIITLIKDKNLRVLLGKRGKAEMNLYSDINVAMELKKIYCFGEKK